MAIELGGVTLEQLTHVAVRERARIVQHTVPGLDGDLAQALGRPSVEVSIRGIFYGASAADDLKQLRDAYLAREPVDFFAEAIGEGYFAQVLISRLEVQQRAAYLDQFDFACYVVEYVEPPEPVAADPLAALDSNLAGEAGAFVDDVQNAVAQVSQLTDLLANAPSFGNPTKQLPEMLDRYKTGIGSDKGVLSNIQGLFSYG
jgi:hypothetical protein